MKCTLVLVFSLKFSSEQLKNLSSFVRFIMCFQIAEISAAQGISAVRFGGFRPLLSSATQ